MSTVGVEWGPVGTWAGAIATVLVVITTALVALGYFGGSGVRGCGSPLRPSNHGAVRARPRGTARPCGSGSGWRTRAPARLVVVLVD
jgi:hypothetical protein